MCVVLLDVFYIGCVFFLIFFSNSDSINQKTGQKLGFFVFVGHGSDEFDGLFDSNVSSHRSPLVYHQVW